MEITCQNCIDMGTNNFVDCENTFYKQMDSILNIVYKQLKTQMDTNQFSIVKKEQILWLKRRNSFFKSQDSEIGKSGGGVEADKALAIHKEALFVKDRIEELLKKLK